MKIGLKQYNHVIWDWNGTLINDVWLAVDIMNKMLAKRGLPLLTIDSYKEVFDFPVIDYYARLGFDFHKEPFEIVGTEFIENYNIRHFECELHSPVYEIVDQLNKHSISQSILSARKQQQLDEEIIHYKLDNYIKFLIGLDNHYAGSKVENGLLLLKELHLRPKDVVLIGDTKHDFDVAMAMGIDCILVATGHHNKEKLKECNAPVIDSLDELFSIS